MHTRVLCDKGAMKEAWHVFAWLFSRASIFAACLFLSLGGKKKQGDNGTRGRESACRSGRCRREEANMLPANQNHQRRPETFPAYQKGDELLAAKKEASLVMGAKSRCIACCICSEEVAEALVGKTRGSLSIKSFFSLVVGETF